MQGTLLTILRHDILNVNESDLGDKLKAISI